MDLLLLGSFCTLVSAKPWQTSKDRVKHVCALLWPGAVLGAQRLGYVRGHQENFRSEHQGRQFVGVLFLLLAGVRCFCARCLGRSSCPPPREVLCKGAWLQTHLHSCMVTHAWSCPRLLSSSSPCAVKVMPVACYPLHPHCHACLQACPKLGRAHCLRIGQAQSAL